MFRQVLFGAGNQGNHHFEKSLLTNKLWHVFMGMKQKKAHFPVPPILNIFSQISKSRRRKRRHNVNFKKWGLDRRLDCFPALVSMSFIWILKYFCTSFIDNAWVSIAINIYDLQVLSTFLFRSRKCFEFTFIDNKIMLIVSPLFSLYVNVFEDQIKLWKNLSNWQDGIFQALLAKRMTIKGRQS